jgi:(2Fe-2S) ferredoxin
LKKIDVRKLESLRRRLKGRSKPRACVIVHMGTCGIASGAEEVLAALFQAAEDLGQEGVRIKTSGCAGLCSREPMITVETAGSPPVKYREVNPAGARRIYEEHVLGGRPVGDYVLGLGCENLR